MPLVTLDRLSIAFGHLPLLDEVALVGVSVSRGMLQAVTGSHREGEQLVGPESPLARKHETEHDGYAEQEKSR